MQNTTTNNPYGAYRQTSIATASPEKLLLMLFDGAIRFLNQARFSLEQQDFETANKWLGKLQDAFIELKISLDMNQGEVASNLHKLYDFYQREVLLANVEKSTERLQPVEDFLRAFRETWAEAAKIVHREHLRTGE
ncbi:flagellar export chaperone FliS [Desulfosporosinus sp. FKA]|uniref:flagellar export chaperone FliS n=1 Tax=Desulfosporosinus sp. FKA TaxID=1969834 RepID=UPI000B49E354|nr:flagellar export chaperone FliS [Desulfosporosinus sp. FKA]